MAVLIGMIGAFVYTGWSKLMLLLKIDDVVDAVAVHGACGMWGVIAASLFAKGELSAEYASICQYHDDETDCDGLFYGGNGKLLGMAVLIGMIGAFVYTGWSKLMLLLKIDDVVDAVAVHGACGMWGVIAASLFAKGELSAEYASICQYHDDETDCDGLFYGGNGKLLGMAFLQITMIWLWVGITMGIAFFVFDLLKLLRVSVQDETYGLDASHHGGMDEDQINPLGSDALMQMRDEGAKLDKTSLLAMCIDQNVQPLPILAKFDKVAGPSGVIEDEASYGQLLELVGFGEVEPVESA
jgi:ammonia channel protein AmtB